MIIFGGYTVNGQSNLTHCLNLKTMKWSPLSLLNNQGSKLPNARIFFCSGLVDNEFLIFGGRYDVHDPHLGKMNFQYFNDSWTLRLQKI